MPLIFTTAEVSAGGTTIRVSLFMDGEQLPVNVAGYAGFGVSTDTEEPLDPLTVVSGEDYLTIYLNREVKSDEEVTVSYAGVGVISTTGEELSPFSSLATNSSVQAPEITPAAVFSYFTSSNRQDAFKADVSGLATALDLEALPKKNVKYRYTNYSTGPGVDEVTITDAN